MHDAPGVLGLDFGVLSSFFDHYAQRSSADRPFSFTNLVGGLWRRGGETCVGPTSSAEPPASDLPWDGEKLERNG